MVEEKLQKLIKNFKKIMNSNLKTNPENKLFGSRCLKNLLLKKNSGNQKYYKYKKKLKFRKKNQYQKEIFYSMKKYRKKIKQDRILNQCIVRKLIKRKKLVVGKKKKYFVKFNRCNKTKSIAQIDFIKKGIYIKKGKIHGQKKFRVLIKKVVQKIQKLINKKKLLNINFKVIK